MIAGLYRPWLFVVMIVLLSLANNPEFLCMVETPEALDSANPPREKGSFTNLRFIRLSKFF
jgi:hypothetical protein